METSEAPQAEEILAAKSLADADARTLAIALKTSGGLLVSDVAKQLSASSDPAAAQSTLAEVGLVETETVVICNRTSRQVARVPSRDALARLDAEGVRCACGTPITEERIEDALTTTKRGRQLMDGSKLMSLLLAEELVKLGVKRSHIAVEQTVGGDELDCVAVIGGALVLFELKDKEFNLGNAYSFGAKISLVRPLLPVIITSAHVGGDAKDHFARIQAAPSERASSVFRSALASAAESSPRPVQYIEGLDNLSTGLAEIASEIDTSSTLNFLREVLPLGSLNPPDVLDALRTPQKPAPTRASASARKRSTSGRAKTKTTKRSRR
jgi:hypothetical protein